MSEVREHYMLEAMRFAADSKAQREANRQNALQEAVEKMQKQRNDYHSIIEARDQRERLHGQLLEAARNNALSTAIKAIYITALEAGTLTDDAIVLAESMVDNWIKEKGGARKIFNECKTETYLLARLQQIVEDAAKEEVEEIEKDESEPEIDEKKEDKKDEADEKPEEKKEESSEDKKEDEPASEEPKEEKPEEKKEEKEPKTEEPAAEPETKSEGPSDPATDLAFSDDEDDAVEAETSGDDYGDDDDPTDDDTDAAEEIIDDEPIDTDPVSVDGDTENAGKVFDELENEEDVRKAIQLIRKRVADAEEAFIKRNAEDKKQIDELLAKISDNVKTVEDLSDDENPESKIAQESVRMQHRKIQDIRENRPLTVLEKMTRNLSAGIVKDEVVREHYMTESNELDMGMIVESAKVMYGFLETLNTLQLEKVDANYIAKVLTEMN